VEAIEQARCHRALHDAQRVVRQGLRCERGLFRYTVEYCRTQTSRRRDVRPRTRKPLVHLLHSPAL